MNLRRRFHPRAHAWLERTAQAYMRVARSYGELAESKSATVADLSFRDALTGLAKTGSLVKQLPPASLDRFIQRVESDGDDWRRAVRQVRTEDAGARHRRSLETPRAMLPPPNGRKVCVARNPEKRQWLLAIGPSVSSAELKQKQEAALNDDEVVEQHAAAAEFEAEAERLEAEARELRNTARLARENASMLVRAKIAPVRPYTETYDFQADEQVDARLATLSEQQVVEELLAARNSAAGQLVEIKRGYWGDMRLGYLDQFEPGPGDWTSWGSPEWLDKMFAGWSEPRSGAGAPAGSASAPAKSEHLQGALAEPISPHEETS
jgi:hypothetical protein